MAAGSWIGEIVEPLSDPSAECVNVLVQINETKRTCGLADEESVGGKNV